MKKLEKEIKRLTNLIEQDKKQKAELATMLKRKCISRETFLNNKGEALKSY